jgi:glycosyltransferase involved in cell wall biosynthesis
MQFVPDIPLVVKLHTPAFLIKKLSSVQLFFHIKVRHSLNLIRKGINPIDCWYYNPKLDPERDHALDADEVVILTESMVDQVVKPWGLDAQKVSYIPNPYIPSEKLLSIPIDTRTDVVTFLGRLETRKGVIDLAKAIPLVLKRYPKATFRFVGRSKDAPNLKRPMREHLEQMLQPYRQSVEFIEGVPLDEIPSILASTDICIFPSIWENFPNVCLEAMAAGRGVVGSSAGGMTEMLDNGKAGRLAPPRNPREIANAVIELLENPELRMQLGQIARDRLLSEYNADRIGTLLEASYTRAIERRHAAGSRHPQASASFR